MPSLKFAKFVIWVFLDFISEIDFSSFKLVSFNPSSKFEFIISKTRSEKLYSLCNNLLNEGKKLLKLLPSVVQHRFTVNTV